MKTTRQFNIGTRAFILAAGVACTLLTTASHAQSLMSSPPPPPPETAQPQRASQDMRSTSLLLVEEPEPREYAIHDKITIIISETSRQSSQQKSDLKKDTNFSASLKEFPDLAKLLEAELANGDGSPVAEVGISSGEKFKGDGKYERSDRFTDRITATVIDVKPNGVLVLEARRTIQKDKEIQTVVLSGECRRDDVTAQNTVLSNQLADMVLSVQNEGDVKDTATKGWITQLFDAIFDF